MKNSRESQNPTAWSSRRQCRLLAILTATASALPTCLQADATLWTFSNSADRFAAASGSGSLTYHDPDSTGWGPAGTVFDKASSLGLPPMTGGDPDVMSFPACTARQGYRLLHASPANGPYGDSNGKISNYTLILDVLYPAASNGRWRALYQADTNNASDAEFYVQNAASGGIGTIGVYHGSVPPNSWHRITIVMQSAPGEGKCQRFIDGRFVGGIGSTGSGLDIRWALDAALLLLTDDDGETAAGYLSSVCFVDRAMRMEEIQALGGPHAAGALTPGAPAPPLTQQMPRQVGVIGHRGGFFCCAPDNTLAAVRRAITNHAPVIEIDTRLSADGVCILLHDSTVDRTTDGTGAAASLTVAQLKTFDAGSWFAPEFAGERIPTLAEVMTEAKGKLILYFDLKVTGQTTAITNAIAQTGFDPDDCWFWVYNNAGDAASIRSRLPNAKIIWEAPGTWASDPNFFNTMRSYGVYGFDQGTYYGTASPAFVRAAKQEGFIVSVYTILDPDTMVRNAAVGVDFMETDFPQIMHQIEPPQFAQASGPTPANGALNVSPNPMLTWVVGSNATAHRVYFGTSGLPDFLREHTSDLVPRTNLLANTTYFWRVDEVTLSGVVTGDVWSFTVAATLPPTNATYEWTFDLADLSPALGRGAMEYADGTTADLTTFGVTDGASVPHIGGQPAGCMHVPALTGLGDGYYLSFTDSGPNGGGAYINQFTFIADVLIPGSLNWTPLFNTNPGNANDADFYVSYDGSVGIAALGYSGTGIVTANNWSRIAFAADLGAGLVTFYVNGTQVFQRTGASLLEGRFSLFSNNDLGPDFLLFNEGDTGGVYTHELYVNSIAFTDRTLSAPEVAALGGPRAEGIFAQRAHVTRAGTAVNITWAGAANVRLQKATSLSNPDWQDVPGTLGANSFAESTPTGTAFYRLLRL
jgi:glycerophosphoryl diester phosphodiesterase